MVIPIANIKVVWCSLGIESSIKTMKQPALPIWAIHRLVWRADASLMLMVPWKDMLLKMLMAFRHTYKQKCGGMLAGWNFPRKHDLVPCGVLISQITMKAHQFRTNGMNVTDQWCN
jgi:hypothetical protein